MPFKDEQIVIIAPGSQTTLAQLGIQESIAPAQLRIRSCMFPAEKDGEWEPYKVRPWLKSSETPAIDEAGVPVDRSEPEYYEDYATEEGAVWPMEDGKIVNWSCLFALLQHVHRRLSPHLHSPMLLVAQPCWTARDYEKLTQFFFEKFKPPCFIIVDSALTSLWAYNTVNACVVDVGYQKADVTAISEFSVHIPGRGVALGRCGGEAMTERLLELLKSKGFDKEMCEQLKQSPICEILPPGVPLPGSSNSKVGEVSNPAAAASTGAIGSGPGQRISAGALGDAPLGPGPGTEVGEEAADPVESDGVLDVASIVTAGNKKMEEFLARKEKEKSDKAKKTKKDADAAAASAKQAKLRNADKERATFVYELPIHLRGPTNGAQTANGGEATTAGAENANGNQPGSTQTSPKQIIPPSGKEVEVGLERFQAAGDIVERIADAIHLAVSSVEDVAKRSDVWDNLIVVGNGSKIKGFREALITTIQKKYIISPSSATIFTSELPSHMTTPTGTGANTPQPQSQLGPHGLQSSSSNVNPLLLAAVTSQNAHLQPTPSGLPSAHSQNIHSSHGQTPTSVKFAKMGEYFPEWKDVGFDEAQFLGAQVMAKVLFVVDGGQSKGYFTRADYNELGPQGIHEFGP
ncbi:actin-like ATPase domain-containing protein [Microthyrium microscopicum]|uniref:Actin-like ATPase domain-containing protein n=1 Tax=Microthyrium microscopicum TaxID=703497 RepID=A0A6A6UM85_9PEZI|nr:actin-like ATPase domain-containing protein [Microthyrium microscopicum]